MKQVSKYSTMQVDATMENVRSHVPFYSSYRLSNVGKVEFYRDSSKFYEIAARFNNPKPVLISSLVYPIVFKFTISE